MRLDKPYVISSMAFVYVFAILAVLNPSHAEWSCPGADMESDCTNKSPAFCLHEAILQNM